MDKSKQQKCLINARRVANMEVYQKLADHGNAQLGHIWKYTPNEIHKVMECITSYVVNHGGIPNEMVSDSMMLRRLEFYEADMGIRVDCWNV